MPKRTSPSIVALSTLALALVGGQAGFGPRARVVRAPPTRSVTYAGATFTVPASWPVVDLAADPSKCVRSDAAAVYLGHAGPDPQCPSHLIGRADGLQIEAADTVTVAQSAKATAAGTINGEPVKLDPAASATGETRVVVPRLAVIATLSRSPANSVIDQVLASLRAGAAAGKATAPLPTTARPSAGARTAQVRVAPAAWAAGRGPAGFVGEGFDACTAPSEATMDAWRASPYHSVGIYLGGINRACSQANLTSQWVSDETNQGWLLVPTYVGRQAPCNSGLGLAPIDPAQADGQGHAAADDAVNAAAALGLTAGTPIYNDMEGYDASAPGCSSAVVAFLQGWTNGLHARGYISGVYGSAASTISDLRNQYTNRSYASPDDIWLASWSCCPHSAYGDPLIPDSYWSPHRRLHQYQGGHTETYAGVTINIDSNYDDGAVAGAIPGYVLDGWGGLHPLGGAPAQPGAAYWPGRDITRALVLQPHGFGGYVLDDWGGIHPFGGAPPVAANGYWPGQDVARDLALNPCDSTGTSGYVLDDWGGVHPFGGAPSVVATGYWPGWDIARALTMTCSQGRPVGQVLEGWGGLHPVGGGPSAAGEAYWPGRDVGVAAVLTSPTSGYTLDSWGAVHEFGGAPPMRASAYWPGTRMARSLALTSGRAGGYVLDAYGGVHWFGSAAPQDTGRFSAPLARGIVLAG